MSGNPRAIAARILASLLREHRPLDQLLKDKSVTALDHRDQAFVQELCYGVARWYFRLEFLLGKLLNKAPREKDLEIKTLLLCGMYQIEFLRTPAHAAVSASVDAVQTLGRDWARGTVNAVLRRYLRERVPLQEKLSNDIMTHAHPGWLLDLLREDWPDKWEQIAAGNNERPPLHLRVNRLRIARTDYLRTLEEMGIAAHSMAWNDCGIALAAPVDVAALPGFQEGLVSVQDCGAQFAAGLLDAQPGERVLDACAAPGGKAGHILESQPQLQELIAVEHNPMRVKLLRQTLDRLGLSATVIHADVSDTAAWWDGEQFDRILLDVPCSATGVIRRHPDIKLSGRLETLPLLLKTQRQILGSIWPLLKRKGKLVYSTCSILRRENDDQIAAHLQQHPDAAVVPVDAEWGCATVHGRQTLPGFDEMDGFYYAILEKQNAGA
ncbi:MAG: 16S rRNA (cytosine(967)-C(5))-methyltransferase RsmB [Gammaproteobacteria bacterium]|jgi:16S rRNA (cytosine967-C5)-methyltransferase|nr:MAG: 16S rRNA (cytosine(967)-C(5))-methyltransferase RsmB [Gammaproteobacteria bacterium]